MYALNTTYLLQKPFYAINSFFVEKLNNRRS